MLRDRSKVRDIQVCYTAAIQEKGKNPEQQFSHCHDLLLAINFEVTLFIPTMPMDKIFLKLTP